MLSPKAGSLFSMQSLIASRLLRGAAKIEMRDKRPIEAAGKPWLRSLLPPIYACRALFWCCFIPMAWSAFWNTKPGD